MPVKKNTTKKNPEKKSAKKTTKRTTKKTSQKPDIKKAMQEIPALIMKERADTMPKQKEVPTQKVVTSAPKPIQVAPVYESPEGSRTWLGIGVSIFTIAVLLLWGFNLSNVLYTTQNTTDEAENILTTSRNELKAIINTFSAQEKDIIPMSTTTPDMTDEAPLTDDMTTTTATNSLESALNSLLGNVVSSTSSTPAQEDSDISTN